MQRNSKRSIVIGGALAAVLSLSSAAEAAMMSVSDGRPVQGQMITLSGGGCKGGVRVTLKGFGETTVGSARLNGTFDITIQVPRNAPVGSEWMIGARCWVRNGVKRYFNANVRVSHELFGPVGVFRGQFVRYSGNGCAPNSDVVASFNGYDRSTTRANGAGEYSIAFRIPPRAPIGKEALIAVRCDQVYPPGSRHVDRKVVDVIRG